MSLIQNKKLHNQLIKISGIGDSKADELIKSGLKYLSDLKKIKYKNMLSKESKLELNYSICENISRSLSTKIINILPADWIPVGSYRREEKTNNDLDFLCLSDLDYAFDMLYMIGQVNNLFDIIEEYKNGLIRKSILIKLNNTYFDNLNCQYIKLDLFKTDKKNLPFALFHYTGNKLFNIRTRAHAKNLGYKLNQYGLFKPSEGKNDNDILIDHIFNDEIDIFNFLGITYKLPRDRSE